MTEKICLIDHSHFIEFGEYNKFLGHELDSI